MWSPTDAKDQRCAQLLALMATRLPASDYEGAKSALDELCALTRESAGFQFLRVEQLCALLEPVPYVVEALDICPGRPTQIVGTGFSGKTLAVQSMLTSIILGSDVWGAFPCRRGPCTHLDYEMGQRAILARYRRVAAGQGVSFEADVAPHLSLACLPREYLNSPTIADHLRRAAEGRVLVVIDSLRRSLPGIDENDSAISRYIDVMTKVSEETGAVFLFVHHATTKRGAGEDRRGDGRGSSAIFDASGAVLSLSGPKAGPVQVTQTKAPERGAPVEDFSLRIVDVEIDGEPAKGLAVRHERVDTRSGAREHASDVQRVVDVVERAGPGGVPGAERVAALAAMRAQSAREALKLAVERGNVVKRGPENRPVYLRAPSPSSSRPLKGTGRADDSSRDEWDERDERPRTGGPGDLDGGHGPDYASDRSAPAPRQRPGAWPEPDERSEHENE